MFYTLFHYILRERFSRFPSWNPPSFPPQALQRRGLSHRAWEDRHLQSSTIIYIHGGSSITMLAYRSVYESWIWLMRIWHFLLKDTQKDHKEKPHSFPMPKHQKDLSMFFLSVSQIKKAMPLYPPLLGVIVFGHRCCVFSPHWPRICAVFFSARSWTISGLAHNCCLAFASMVVSYAGRLSLRFESIFRRRIQSNQSTQRHVSNTHSKWWLTGAS